jgi:formylglycine-generating enzyme required for sulfatase activity
MEFVNTFSTQGIDIAGPGRIFTWGAVLDTSYLGPGTRYKLNPAAPNAAARPVFGINWRDCARFVNWLNNDKSSSPDALTHGAYDTSTFTFNEHNNTFNDQLYHDPDAKYWIPTLDEWLKAAHYDPDKYGQGQEGWWEYSTMSDTPPIPGPPGVGQTSAGDPQGPGEPSPFGYPLGAYPDTVSPWGLLDTSGGASEWLEEPFSPGILRIRGMDGARAGSSYAEMFVFDSAGTIDGLFPTSGATLGGLRIASAVPAPSSATGVALGIFAMSIKRRRRK